MVCANHGDRAAVACCVVCGKLLCPECAAGDGRVIACAATCQPAARRLADYREFCYYQVAAQQKLQRRWAWADVRSGLLSVALGLGIAAYGLYDVRARLALYCGAVMVLFGVLSLWFSRQSWRRESFRMCRHCGYNMTGNATGRCPECGQLG